VQRSLQRSVIETRKYEIRCPKRSSMPEATAELFANQDWRMVRNANRAGS
jgi:hypothetical protein